MRSLTGLGIFIVTAALTLIPVALLAADHPLSGLRPTVITLESGVNAYPTNTAIELENGTSYPALVLRYQSRLSYDIPSDAQSFHAILTRTPNGDPNANPEDFNRIRVCFMLDDKLAYESVLETTTPAEQFGFAIGSAKKLTIVLDQMLAGGAVYLADASFSIQSVPDVTTSHILGPGTAFANLGSNVEQLAFRTYHPGQSVPLQLDFGGAAAAGTASITIEARQQSGSINITVPVVLHTGNGSSTGTASWQVPPVLGPAVLDLRVTVNGKQVYRKQVNIAIAREVDVARESSSSTFGIHLSSAGIPYLADSVASLWGAKWGRVFLRWEVVEFTRGQYDWSRIDNVINLYLGQHMRVLGVLGETAPKWAAPSGPETVAAFNQFVKAAIEHFKGKIEYWDVYNEIDSKYHGGEVMDKKDPSSDLTLLRDEMNIIRSGQHGAKLVCCSTGTSYWLAYDKRLYDDHLLSLMDILSLHPYQSGPPEERDGVQSYVEMIDSLRDLEHSYGANKPVWNTEANWLIGPATQPGVIAPYVDDHQQSQYLVRVNLLSMAMDVPYFVHSPFFTPYHRELLLDGLSSYANMTYNLGAATGAKRLELPDGVFGITASSASRTICVLWTTRRSATVRLAGMAGAHFEDIYGNPVAYRASAVPLTGDPIYVVGTGTPSVSVDQIAAAQIPKPLPNPWTWSKSFLTTYNQTKNGVRVTTRSTNYGDLLKSPEIAVSPNSCYVITANIHTYQGGVAMVAIDSASGKKMEPTLNIFNVTGNDYQPELKLRTGSASQVQIVMIADNPNDPQVTEFEISNAKIAPCDQ